uniref:MATH domain-containing protein n=1 Tax=Leersia perrieri TaxID=77586 RepID=A0A0D9XUD9_9ORYZ
MESSFKFAGWEHIGMFGYVKDDSIAIRCDITVVENAAVLDPVVVPADLERLGWFASVRTSCVSVIMSWHYHRNTH